MAQDSFIKFRIKATQLDKVDIRSMLAMDAIGHKAFDLMRERVTSRHLDEDGKALPAYRVQVDKVRATPANLKSAERKRGSGWTKSGPPPDIYIQIRKLGGVNKAGTNWQGGTPIRYSMTSPVKEKRGAIWGYHWDSKEDYLRANYGGSQVDHLVSGTMWRSKKIRAKATRAGNPSVTVGFQGSVPQGSIYTLLKEGPGTTASGKERKVTATVRALLANSRGPDGKLTMSNPREWLGMTGKEMGEVINVLGQDLMDDLDKIPVTVKVKG